MNKKNEKGIYACWHYFSLVVLLTGLIIGLVFSFINDEPYELWGVTYNMSILTIILLGLVLGFFCMIGFRMVESLTVDYDRKEVRYNGFGFGSMKKIASDEWNNRVKLAEEVESIEIVKLSKSERRKFLKAKYILNYRHLKFNIIGGQQKYINLSMFSKGQIEKLVKIIQTINPAIQVIS